MPRRRCATGSHPSRIFRPVTEPASRTARWGLAWPSPAERPLVLWAAAYFFCLFASYSLVKPVREAFGIQRSADDLPWLITGTLVAVLLANPAFSALASRFPRRRFIPLAYHFFAACMLGFAALLRTAPERYTLGIGYAFYIWLSVFNLLAVSVFWSLMADVFSREQGKRLFPLIGVGGTLGGIAGPAAATWLATRVSPAAMILISAALLELTVLCVVALTRLSGLGSVNPPTPEPGPGVLDGMRAVARSPYLLLTCLHYFLYTLLSTFLYLEQQGIIRAALPSAAERTVMNARIDLWVNSLTVALQVLVAGRLVAWLGVGMSLALVHAVSFLGFAALAVAPRLGLSLLTAVVAFQVARRALNYAVSNPARQVLFTVLGPDEKYKSKAFIDTFIYRAGDLAGAWTPKPIGATGIPLPLAALPISAAGVAVALVLGRMLSRRRAPD
jgi:AAA family ATP:ADP antiporter